MPGQLEAFTQGGDTVTISATTTSASSAFTQFSADIRINNLLVSNSGSVWVFVTSGVGAATASATKIPIAPGAQAVIAISPTHTFVAAITVSGTATVYFSPGFGA